jgi:hypothetical protein
MGLLYDLSDFMPSGKRADVPGGLAGNVYSDNTTPYDSKTAVRQASKISLTARRPSFRIWMKIFLLVIANGCHKSVETI